MQISAALEQDTLRSSATYGSYRLQILVYTLSFSLLRIFVSILEGLTVNDVHSNGGFDRKINTYPDQFLMPANSPLKTKYISII